MEHLRETVSGLLDDLGNINPQQVLESFSKGFDTITGSLKWIVENKDVVVSTMKSIVVGWGALKLTGGALQILKLIDGLKEFGLSGVPATGDQTGTNTPFVAGTGDASKRGILNTLTLFGMAGAYYEGVEGQLRDILKRFEEKTAGMTDAERAKQALIENFNMTEEDYAELQRKMNEGVGAGVPFEAIPELPEDVTTTLLDQIGVLKLPAEVYLTDIPGGSGTNEEQEKANGIWAVPYDGYLARLHKNERVVPAREVSSRSFISNLYIENNYMHNNMDADALANAIASRNRRMMSGYGS